LPSSTKAGWRWRIHYNAPFTLTLGLACVLASVALMLTGGRAANLFSVWGGSWLEPLFYVRPFLHILGHGSLEHLFYNLTLLLLLGPLLEEKYGWPRLALLTVATALITALPMLFLLPGQLMGASGVIFAMIILSSYTRSQKGTLPLTFLLVCLVFLGQEIYRGFTQSDQVAQFAHLLGGLVGMIAALRWTR